MRSHERKQGLLKTPLLIWNILARGYYPFVYDQMPIHMYNMTLSKRFNLLKSGANLVHRRLKPWSMPLHMQFEIANYCNLQCPVCPTGIHAIDRKKQVMPVELFESVVDQVGPSLLTASLWAWGEPLLHPDLKGILKASRKHPFIKFLSTNGQFLNKERVIDALITEPPDFLIVAIDGLTDETNTKFRSGATLDPVLEGVKKLAELKKELNQDLPVLHMRFIVMKHNQHQVPDLADFAREHHFDLLTIRTLSIIDTDAPDSIHKELIPDSHSLCAYQYADQTRVEREDYYCLEPFWFPTLFADGTVVACEQDYNAKLAMGRVTESIRFKNIWTSSQATAVRQQIRDSYKNVSFCRNCPYRDRETTDVSIQAHYINKDIDYKTLFA